MRDAPLPLGATIGLLGGGQLGRMLAAAASELGFICHIYCPDLDSPAFDMARYKTVASYDDEEALMAFAKSVDVVTYEFENVPARTAELISHHVALRPGVLALSTAQDRLSEKRFLSDAGVPIARFATVSNQDELRAGLSTLGGSGVLKTRRFGYDGKGQVMIKSISDIAKTEALVTAADGCVLEEIIPFDHEISVVAARSLGGRTEAYEAGRNDHHDHILRTTTLPTDLSEQARRDALSIANVILEQLNYIGIIGIEFFVLRRPDRDRLLVNEIAPRVHNSGHWTQDAARTSQFEQHIRAVAGWPLGNPMRTHNVVMENLIGDDVLRVPKLASDQSARCHIYGKSAIRPGRKMGHVNWIGTACH